MWIEQKKVTRPTCNSRPNSWECEVTYDLIIIGIIVDVNVCLNNRHCKVGINMTSQININSKTKSIVVSCIFLLDEDGDGTIVLKWTRDLAQVMCRITSVSMYPSNAYSARLRTLCNKSVLPKEQELIVYVRYSYQLPHLLH